MLSDKSLDRTLAEYKALEVELHRDLMNVCRRYINNLGIVSIMGMLDIVKQEATELERATQKMTEDRPSEPCFTQGSKDEFPTERQSSTNLRL